jgi:Flp pilus assembly secretin CpaC
VQSTVELGEGMTMSVAGLLDDSVIATRQSLPGLGDLPVIGQLFRSTRYQRKETELVILITPRLAAAMNPDQVTALPGANWRHPNELEQAFLGDIGGNPEADATRDAFKKPSERGLRAADRAPRTGGHPLAAGDTTSADAVAESVPAPLFVGEHGFAPVRQAAPESASVQE